MTMLPTSALDPRNARFVATKVADQPRGSFVDQRRLVHCLEESGPLGDQPTCRLGAGRRRPEGDFLLDAKSQDLLQRPGDVRMVVVARMAHLYREITRTHVEHIHVGSRNDLFSILVTEPSLDMHNDGCLLVLVGHPDVPVGGRDVAAVAPTRCDRPAQLRVSSQ